MTPWGFSYPVPSLKPNSSPLKNYPGIYKKRLLFILDGFLYRSYIGTFDSQVCRFCFLLAPHHHIWLPFVKTPFNKLHTRHQKKHKTLNPFWTMMWCVMCWLKGIGDGYRKSKDVILDSNRCFLRSRLQPCGNLFYFPRRQSSGKFGSSLRVTSHELIQIFCHFFASKWWKNKQGWINEEVEVCI